MIPQKIKAGDEIRVIAPAVSMSRLKEDINQIAKAYFNSKNVKITFGKNVYETGLYNSASIEARINDLHDAFSDSNVKCILTAFGGFSSNQLLDYIDYDLIKTNPKILCGYSDITALQNAITHKTGLVTYSGPHYSTFGIKKGNEYTIEYFEKCLMQSAPFEIQVADQWSDEDWFVDQDNRHFFQGEDYIVINQGKAKGKIIGGNICTLNLLKGSQYMPEIEESILFIEDDKISMPQMFDRDLQALIHTKAFEKVKGIVIGRFQIDFDINTEQLTEIIKSKEAFNDIPVIANASFGHTMPLFTFPIGGSCEIEANENKCCIKIVEH